jgi:hypothetical protein
MSNVFSLSMSTSFQVYCTILEWKRETFGTGVRMLINNDDEHFYEESHLTTKQTNQLFLH